MASKREKIDPEKPRIPRENRILGFPKPKKTPKLACCAVGKKSKSPKNVEKSGCFSLADRDTQRQKSAKNHPSGRPLLGQTCRSRNSRRPPTMTHDLRPKAQGPRPKTQPQNVENWKSVDQLAAILHLKREIATATMNKAIGKNYPKKTPYSPRKRPPRAATIPKHPKKPEENAMVSFGIIHETRENRPSCRARMIDRVGWVKRSADPPIVARYRWWVGASLDPPYFFISRRASSSVQPAPGPRKARRTSRQ
jgi:hypothetical protein